MKLNLSNINIQSEMATYVIEHDGIVVAGPYDCSVPLTPQITLLQVFNACKAHALSMRDEIVAARRAEADNLENANL